MPVFRRLLERWGFVKLSQYGLERTPEGRIISLRPDVLDDGNGTPIVGWTEGDPAPAQLERWEPPVPLVTRSGTTVPPPLAAAPVARPQVEEDDWEWEIALAHARDAATDAEQGARAPAARPAPFAVPFHPPPPPAVPSAPPTPAVVRPAPLVTPAHSRGGSAAPERGVGGPGAPASGGGTWGSGAVRPAAAASSPTGAPSTRPIAVVAGEAPSGSSAASGSSAPSVPAGPRTRPMPIATSATSAPVRAGGAPTTPVAPGATSARRGPIAAAPPPLPEPDPVTLVSAPPAPASQVREDVAARLKPVVGTKGRTRQAEPAPAAARPAEPPAERPAEAAPSPPRRAEPYRGAPPSPITRSRTRPPFPPPGSPSRPVNGAPPSSPAGPSRPVNGAPPQPSAPATAPSRPSPGTPDPEAPSSGPGRAPKNTPTGGTKRGPIQTQPFGAAEPVTDVHDPAEWPEAPTLDYQDYLERAAEKLPRRFAQGTRAGSLDAAAPPAPARRPEDTSSPFALAELTTPDLRYSENTRPLVLPGTSHRGRAR